MQEQACRNPCREKMLDIPGLFVANPAPEEYWRPSWARGQKVQFLALRALLYNLEVSKKVAQTARSHDVRSHGTSMALFVHPKQALSCQKCQKQTGER